MIPLHKAANSSAVLASMAQRIQQSQRMLETVTPLLPQPLRPHVSAGPVDGAHWCVLVRNPAVASKMRQLQPALLSALRSAGFQVEQVRIKVLAPASQGAD